MGDLEGARALGPFGPPSSVGASAVPHIFVILRFRLDSFRSPRPPGFELGLVPPCVHCFSQPIPRMSRLAIPSAAYSVSASACCAHAAAVVAGLTTRAPSRAVASALLKLWPQLTSAAFEVGVGCVSVVLMLPSRAGFQVSVSFPDPVAVLRFAIASVVLG